MRVTVKNNSHVLNTSYVSGTILCIFHESPPLIFTPASWGQSQCWPQFSAEDAEGWWDYITCSTLLKMHSTEGLADRCATFIPPCFGQVSPWENSGRWSTTCLSLADVTTAGQPWTVTPEPLLLTIPAWERTRSEGLRSKMRPYPFIVYNYS